VRGGELDGDDSVGLVVAGDPGGDGLVAGDTADADDADVDVKYVSGIALCRVASSNSGSFDSSKYCSKARFCLMFFLNICSLDFEYDSGLYSWGFRWGFRPPTTGPWVVVV
jgi:hypothetical protein